MLTASVSLRDGGNTEAFMGSFTINAVLMAAAAMIAAKTFLEKTWFPNYIYHGIRFFSKVCFGIFLVHDVLRMQMVYRGVDTLTFPLIFWIPLLSAGIFAVSGLIAYILNRIPAIGKYIV